MFTWYVNKFRKEHIFNLRMMESIGIDKSTTGGTKEMSKERLSAFTDAILAIIMTILVLELKKPEAADWASLWALKSDFFSYAVSFFWLGAIAMFAVILAGCVVTFLPHIVERKNK